MNIPANIRISFHRILFGFGQIMKEICSINQIIVYGDIYSAGYKYIKFSYSLFIDTKQQA